MLLFVIFSCSVVYVYTVDFPLRIIHSAKNMMFGGLPGRDGSVRDYSVPSGDSDGGSGHRINGGIL